MNKIVNAMEYIVRKIRKDRPLILHLTNFVIMDFVANCVLSLGASPIMTDCQDELEELVASCSAININIGTLSSRFLDLCVMACNVANKYNKPIILDPVGAGATSIRTSASIQLMQYASIIKGNASEIIAISDIQTDHKGVDSIHCTDDAKIYAQMIASQYKCVVVVSGEIDFITDGIKNIELKYGCKLMQLVTGMGCALGSIIASFAACADDFFEASVMGCKYFAICGQQAANKTKYPGSFKCYMIDALSTNDFNDLES